MLVRVLPSLLLEVAVESLRAAMKGGSVVQTVQRLDSDAGQFHRLCAGPLSVGLGCALEARIRLRRVQQGLHEGQLLFA